MIILINNSYKDKVNISIKSKKKKNTHTQDPPS